MKPLLVKSLLTSVIAVSLILMCSLLAVSDHGGPRFLAVAGFCITFLGSLIELLFPAQHQQRLRVAVGGGVGRGALVGLFAWAGMMLLVSFLSDPGDKFGIYAVYVSPGSLILGGLAGGIVRVVQQRRHMKRMANPLLKVI